MWPATWGGETGSPPLKSCGFFFMNRGFFGGRGIARPPSSSHLRYVHLQYRCVLRRRKDWHLSLPLHMSRCSSDPASSEGEGQALFLTMSVRSASACWLCSAGCSTVGTLRRYHQSGLATACTWVQVGSARDALRNHVVLCVVDVGYIGLVCRRSGRFGDTFRLQCTPGVRLGTWRGEVPHLFAGRIRCSAVDVRTTVGLNRLWGLGFRPVGLASSRAHQILCHLCSCPRCLDNTSSDAPMHIRIEKTTWEYTQQCDSHGIRVDLLICRRFFFRKYQTKDSPSIWDPGLSL